MPEGKFFCYNGKMIDTSTQIISIDNRSFRYGDGCFETMKLMNESIALSHYHFERLFYALQKLKLRPENYFTHSFLLKQILDLAEKNQHQKLARIRLTIFRAGEGLYGNDNYHFDYIIQSSVLNNISTFNEEGLSIDVFNDAKKSCDHFSNIKSNNYLPYAMASIWAKENQLDDAVVLNAYNKIADTTIANIFLVKDGKIKTPALTEGCVAGVMRRHLIKCIKEENISIEETQIEKQELETADEIFLTNAMRGIQWVKQFNKKMFTNNLAKYLHEKFI